MKNKHQVHNLVILDESGSMHDIKSMIVKGFNELVQSTKGIQKQFPEQEHFVSFITFNDLGIKTHLDRQAVSKFVEIDEEKYQPDSLTPLYDAMGFGISRLRKDLKQEKAHNVLVTVLTDGLENASKEYNGNAIKALVEELKQKNWTFTYIGTGHDAERAAVSISISNVMNFDKNESSMAKMFFYEKSARSEYSRKIRAKEDVGESFYDGEL